MQAARTLLADGGAKFSIPLNPSSALRAAKARLRLGAFFRCLRRSVLRGWKMRAQRRRNGVELHWPPDSSGGAMGEPQGKM